MWNEFPIAQLPEKEKKKKKKKKKRKKTSRPRKLIKACQQCDYPKQMPNTAKGAIHKKRTSSPSVERVVVSACRISTHMECHHIDMVLQQGTAGRGTLFYQAR